MKKPARLSSGKIRLKWTSVADANAYEIYRSTKKGSGYEKIATTAKTVYSDGSGTAFKTYYYKVCAIYKENKQVVSESSFSNIKSAKVRKKAQKIAYAGDSIMKGFEEYGVIHNTKAHKVFAKVGIQTSNFYNSNYMDSLLNYKPDRLYVMLGMNCLGRSIEYGYYNHIIEYYRYILEDCLDENPNMEIIVVAVTPVRSTSSVSMTCVRYFNSKLKEMLKKYFSGKDVYYKSLANVLADDNGYLKSAYNGGDGIHWTVSAYKMVYSVFPKLAKKF